MRRLSLILAAVLASGCGDPDPAGQGGTGSSDSSASAGDTQGEGTDTDGESGEGGGDETGGDGDGKDPEVPATPYCYPVGGLMWLDDWREAEVEALARINATREAGTTCGNTDFGPVTPLTMQFELRCAARVHARDMHDRGFFDHDNPDGESPGDRIEKAGYNPAIWAENNAMGMLNPEQVVAGWIASDEHCAILMSPQFSQTGMALYEGETGIYWSQTFGEPN